tara:strand:- start:580 stop:795 length:216 start_codon:yes stop_codon:yes gene_type:complete
MNEEKLNLSLRRFLKNVGITSQRHIEEKVRDYLKSSKNSTSKKIKISANLVSEELNLNENIEGEIDIEISN